MARGTLLAVAVALLVASTGWAQIWYGGASAYELGRGGTGVALPSGPATGSNNPATLGMLYRMPGERAEAMAALEAAGGSGLASWGRTDAGRGLLAFPRGSEFGSLDLDLEGEDWLASALPPADWLVQPGRPQPQVLLETRFATVDQSFLDDLGVNWDPNGRTPLWGIGYTLDTEDTENLQAFQATYGTIGGDWAFGGGWMQQFDEDLFYLAAARSQNSNILARPSILTLGGRVATLEVGEDSRFIADIGATATTDTSLLGAPATFAVGGVLHDLLDETGEFPDAGIRLDLGAAVVGERVALTLDLVDVFDGTSVDDPYVTDSGRHLRLGTEIRVAEPGTFILGGLVRDEFTVGVRQKVPVLGDLPMINLLFSHSEREDRAELVIFVTPHIVRGEE